MLGLVARRAHQQLHRPPGATCVLNPARLTKPPALLDHPPDHPDDPMGPVWIRPDRRPVQPEQARSVWSRPDRRRAPGYGSGGWGFEPLAARQTRRSEDIKQEKLGGPYLAVSVFEC